MRKFSTREQKYFYSRSEDVPLASRKIATAIEKVLGVYSYHTRPALYLASLPYR